MPLDRRDPGNSGESARTLSVSFEFYPRTGPGPSADLSFAAAGHAGALRLAWDDRAADAVATHAGTVDGRALRATRPAP